MNKFLGYLPVSLLLLALAGCPGNKNSDSSLPKTATSSQFYEDRPFRQEYSIRHYAAGPDFDPVALSVNRDGNITILSGHELLVPGNGTFHYPGTLSKDVSYPQLLKKKINAIGTFLNQTVYLDDKQIFSNAWAGRFQVDHGMNHPHLFAMGRDFSFLVSDGCSLAWFDEKGKKSWEGRSGKLTDIRYNEKRNTFLLVSQQKVAELVPGEPEKVVYSGEGITCAEYLSGDRIIIGTTNDYTILPGNKNETKLPCAHLTVVREIDGQIWFGSEEGAFRLNNNGKYTYYAGERWLPGNRVKALAAGPDHTILVLTDKGLGEICSKMMSLEEKAMFYEKQVREKNIRYGFNCSSSRLVDSWSSAQMTAQPSDNLWTGMYLAGQLYRYRVTGSEEARQNAMESFDAMERLFTVTGIRGLFARSFERDYIVDTVRGPGWQKKELLSGSPASMWLPASDHPNWTWRSTASSDQTVGQVFALTTILELSDDPAWKSRALTCLDNLVGYIVKNDMYLLDVDGKPTLWGKWNPDYVNRFPETVSDRKLYSSNIIAILQAAYHFTSKEIYRDKARELMEKAGYLDNLTRPFSRIGPSDADSLSRILSVEWNHSDDEMYFLAYQSLYNYAFNKTLKDKYREAIRDHWEQERPEGNALWNFIYASTGAGEFDLDGSITFLRDYPLDMRNWSVRNSARHDLDLLPPNFRGQTTRELLPLGEIPLYRHNGEIFRLDSQGDGASLISAGDVWLLPYWMGRYLKIIGPPVPNK